MKIEELAEKLRLEASKHESFSATQLIDAGIRAGLKVALKIVEDNSENYEPWHDINEILEGRAELPEVEG